MNPTPTRKGKQPKYDERILELIRKWNAEQRDYNLQDIADELGMGSGAHVLSRIDRMRLDGRIIKTQRLALVTGYVEAPTTQNQAA